MLHLGKMVEDNERAERERRIGPMTARGMRPDRAASRHWAVARDVKPAMQILQDSTESRKPTECMSKLQPYLVKLCPSLSLFTACTLIGFLYLQRSARDSVKFVPA